MWIGMVVIAAFFNALWTALSKPCMEEISPFDFTLQFRFLTALLLLPGFFIFFEIPSDPIFWLATMGMGILELVRITVFSSEIRKDYYSTYAIYNTSPFFTILLAPLFLPERISYVLVLGILAIVGGAWIFYGIQQVRIGGIFCAVSASIGGILSKIALTKSNPYFFACTAFFIGVILMGIAGYVKRGCILAKPVGKDLRSTILKLAFYSFLATTLYYIAMDQAPVTRVNPLVRLNLLFGFFLSYYYLREKEFWPRKLAGGFLVLIGGVLITLS
jgi:drug/metabolite transporter (DMT)-like permease